MGADDKTVVVIEDDRHISDLVALYLRRDGFRVLQQADGPGGVATATSQGARVAIVDVGLPGEMDGFEVCRKLRASGGIALIILTARDDEIDRVLGLELGADDYVTKPFSPRELVARVHAILRRSSSSVTSNPSAVTVLGQLVVDRGRCEVKVDGGPVMLTPREFDLLSFLIENKGLALSRRQLLDGAWGSVWVGDERTVDVHVRQLRRKLGKHFPLRTVRGVGYRLG